MVLRENKTTISHNLYFYLKLWLQKTKSEVIIRISAVYFFENENFFGRKFNFCIKKNNDNNKQFYLKPVNYYFFFKLLLNMIFFFCLFCLSTHTNCFNYTSHIKNIYLYIF